MLEFLHIFFSSFPLYVTSSLSIYFVIYISYMKHFQHIDIFGESIVQHISCIHSSIKQQIYTQQLMMFMYLYLHWNNRYRTFYFAVGIQYKNLKIWVNFTLNFSPEVYHVMTGKNGKRLKRWVKDWNSVSRWYLADGWICDRTAWYFGGILKIVFKNLMVE